MVLQKGKRKAGKLLAVLLAVVLLAAAVCGIYLDDFYHADMEAVEAFGSVHMVEVNEEASGMLTFGSEDSPVGLIFYPGGKVEYTAYIPLMQALAARGVFCVLVEMPFHLAVFDVNAADGVCERYPHITDWYIGGHSLGGAMAASYLSEHTDSFVGLLLLGAYSTADLSETAISVLSIYGSEDAVMDREKYEQNKENLPADFAEVVIDGGCHAYFGMYGAQEGDGVPGITNEEQIILTAEAVSSAILSE